MTSIESTRPAQDSTAMRRKVFLGSFIGTAIEWYDFFIYGLAAALVLGKLFFPSFAPVVGTLSAFAAFSVGFIARPIGGVIFSHFGDRIGRKSALVASLLLMGAATFLIGLLPTYETIGVAAPICLVLLRFCQGVAVGGEWGGAVLMSVEHSRPHRRGLAGSIPQMGVPAGLIMASTAFLALSPLGEAEFAAWGWRIPFLASGILVVIGLMIRLGITESPEFQDLRRENGTLKSPAWTVLRRNPKNVLLAAAMRQETTLFYVLVTFIVSYGTDQVGVSRDVMLNGTTVAAAVALITIPMFGSLSDRFGRRNVFRIGAASAVIFPIPFFALVDTGEPWLIYLALILGLALVHAAMYGPQAAFFSELFGTQVRYSGASLGYQLGSVIGGLSPLVATSLIVATDGSPIYVIAYVAALQVVAFLGATFAPDTRDTAIAAPSVLPR